MAVLGFYCFVLFFKIHFSFMCMVFFLFVPHMCAVPKEARRLQYTRTGVRDGC